MEYRVKFVDDRLLWVEQLQIQLDAALCEEQAGEGFVTLCIRRGARDLSDEAAAKILESAWADYRALCEGRPGLVSA